MDLYAGSAYFVATREFVEWTLKNATAQSIVDWSRDTYSPDEMLWATLTRLEGSPGFLHPNIKWDKNEFQVITRIVKWHSLEEGAPIDTPKSYPKCHGYHKRGICVYGLGDIGWVRNYYDYIDYYIDYYYNYYMGKKLFHMCSDEHFK